VGEISQSPCRVSLGATRRANYVSLAETTAHSIKRSYLLEGSRRDEMSQGSAKRIHDAIPGTGDGTEIVLKALHQWWGVAKDALDQKFDAQTAKIDEIVTGQKAQQRDLTALKADVTEIKDEQNEMKKRLQALEKNQSCSGSQTSTTEGDFIPTYLDFRKFCAFEDHKEHGITRQQATELVEHLTEQLPETYRVHVRDLKINFPKNFSFRVPVTPGYLQEIKTIWQDYIQLHPLEQWPELIIRPELRPEFQKRLRTFGQAQEWARQTLERFNPLIAWGPEFHVMLQKKLEVFPPGAKVQTESVLLFRVAPEAHIEWEEQTIRNFKLGTTTEL